MNLTRLRYFVVTADEGNAVHAARRLRIAQPALSRQLRSLEREVGTKLFERHARGMRLLPAGQAFLEHARRLLVGAEAGRAAAHGAAEGATRPRLRIASPDWPHRAAWVAGAIERLGRRHAEIDVQHDAAPWLVHASALLKGMIDVGFGVAMSSAEYGESIVADCLCNEPASSALLPTGHRLAGRSSITLADLRDIPTLVPPHARAPLLHEQMVGTVRRGGYEPRVVEGGTSLSTTAPMVVAGAGWMLTVHSIAEAPPRGTAVVPISDASVMLQFYVLRRRADERAEVLAFLDCLRDEVSAVRETVNERNAQPRSKTMMAP